MCISDLQQIAKEEGICVQFKEVIFPPKIIIYALKKHIDILKRVYTLTKPVSIIFEYVSIEYYAEGLELD